METISEINEADDEVDSVFINLNGNGRGTFGGTRDRKPNMGVAGSKGINLGVRMQGARAAMSNGLVGFHVVLGKKSKSKLAGPRILDPKNHSVVAINENHDPNVSLDGKNTTGNSLGVKNLISSSSLPDSLKLKCRRIN